MFFQASCQCDCPTVDILHVINVCCQLCDDVLNLTLPGPCRHCLVLPAWRCNSLAKLLHIHRFTIFTETVEQELPLKFIAHSTCYVQHCHCEAIQVHEAIMAHIGTEDGPDCSHIPLARIPHLIVDLLHELFMMGFCELHLVLHPCILQQNWHVHRTPFLELLKQCNNLIFRDVIVMPDQSKNCVHKVLFLEVSVASRPILTFLEIRHQPKGSQCFP
mmetsp:Transcript_70493/g.117759  ORF Transcript_70493/g.117759 Transcript_70493/m.117759 type:complete len:217 (+) Transcript_70493:1421-2071(+)